MIVAAWDDRADDQARIKWVRNYSRQSRRTPRWAAYINFMSDDDQDRVEDNYSGNYRRLGDVKRAYDPDNLFRHNQNIKP